MTGTHECALEWLSPSPSGRLEERLGFLLIHSGASGKGSAWFTFSLLVPKCVGNGNELIQDFSLLNCEVTSLLITAAEKEHHLKNWD